MQYYWLDVMGLNQWDLAEVNVTKSSSASSSSSSSSKNGDATSSSSEHCGSPSKSVGCDVGGEDVEDATSAGDENVESVAIADRLLENLRSCIAAADMLLVAGGFRRAKQCMCIRLPPFGATAALCRAVLWPCLHVIMYLLCMLCGAWPLPWSRNVWGTQHATEHSITQAKKTNVAGNAWDNPSPIYRSWCLYEMYLAHKVYTNMLLVRV